MSQKKNEFEYLSLGLDFGDQSFEPFFFASKCPKTIKDYLFLITIRFDGTNDTYMSAFRNSFTQVFNATCSGLPKSQYSRLTRRVSTESPSKLITQCGLLSDNGVGYIWFQSIDWQNSHLEK
jgi:hypothetical protein